MGIVRESEAGTMEQLIVTPIRPYQLIVGKLLPFVLIGLVDATFVIAVARVWFGVPVRGSLPLLFALCLAFMLNTLGIGLFVSTISRTQQQAMLTSLFFIMPQIMLSGFVFPIENMPRFFQAVTTIVPLRYFFVIIRGIMLKGAGWRAPLAPGRGPHGPGNAHPDPERRPLPEEARLTIRRRRTHLAQFVRCLD